MSLNPFEMAKKQIDMVAEQIDLDPNIHKYLKRVERALIVSVPIKMDDGSIQIFEGYRVHHSTIRGPGKGGIRFSPYVDSNEVKALATWMTWKTSLLNLPLGGSKGGVCFDPAKLSDDEIQRITRRYTSEVINLIGPDIDIPAPDVNTSGQIMAWVMDTYSMNKGRPTPGVVTGKPIEIGGSVGRATATGTGLFFVLQALCEKLAMNLKEQEIIVQGFGNVGGTIAELLYDHGCKIIALSDISGGLYVKDGLPIDTLSEWRDKGQLLTDYEDPTHKIKTISNVELLTSPCDILIPAAVENQITGENAADINTKIVLEGANGPTTLEADKILKDKETMVVPDILANSGGVCVSYFEYIQDVQSYFWDLERVNKELKDIIVGAFNDVWNLSQEEDVTLRIAAYMIAVNRVAKAVKFRGFFP
ncbi:MAG: Glu/Leu/Phe/Val dehydrogenase [Promethearchaeia archaeon]